jgi:hypothetical protein
MNLVLGLGRYVLDINSGLIADWHWYKAGMPHGIPDWYFL